MVKAKGTARVPQPGGLLEVRDGGKGVYRARRDSTGTAPYAPLDALEDAEGDTLDEEGRRRLHEALDEGEAQYQRGEVIPAEVVMQELRAILASQ